MRKLASYIAKGVVLIAFLVVSDVVVPPVEARPLSNPEVRRAISSGQVIPFSVAIQRARAFTKGGDVLRANLVQNRTGLVYRLRMLLRNGRVMIVFVDARSGRIIGSR